MTKFDITHSRGQSERNVSSDWQSAQFDREDRVAAWQTWARQVVAPTSPLLPPVRLWHRNLLDCAQDSLGQRLWLDHSAVAEQGRFGCALAVSSCLRRSGVKVGSPSVCALAFQLEKLGWQRLPLHCAHAGDIIYGVMPGTAGNGASAHIGIVGRQATVYHNSSRSRVWTQSQLSAVFPGSRFGCQRWILRAPHRQS